MHSNEFVSVDEDNLIVREAKVVLKEVNDYCTDFFPFFVGFINRIDQPLVSNDVVLSLKYQLLCLNASHNFKLGI
jgi:hypothetical protein